MRRNQRHVPTILFDYPYQCLTPGAGERYLRASALRNPRLDLPAQRRAHGVEHRPASRLAE
jgi:hypothetical protein